ncbi:MAG: ATP-binding cassette domain-containing protein, partial [Clostridiales bacterium]|nr:ATP-binding cassette domain-containing protein [Clostridiales bacterium]
MIEITNLTKKYGGKTAVNDVTFRVEQGEILGFLGPNGAGKTTTM